MRPPSILAATCLVGALALAACGATASEQTTMADYLGELQAICSSTTAQLQALPSAPEQISVTDLATRAAELLDNEATQAGRLAIPSGRDVAVDDLAGDHRAFVRNTQDQADAWRKVAAGSPADLADSTQLIAQLVGGRNQLADSMGAPDCVRGNL
jgi:hypothetical protein